MNIVLEPTQADQLDVTRTGERAWTVHHWEDDPTVAPIRTYDNQAAAWHHAVWTPLHTTDTLPQLYGTTRQLFTEEGTPKNATADPRRAARVQASEYDEGRAKVVTDLITAFIQSRINDPAHMTIYGEEAPMSDETTETETQETPQETPQESQNTASESPTADDGATTPEDARKALREALSDSDRNAWDNYSHMAESAPSEQARDFWQGKADEVAANAA